MNRRLLINAIAAVVVIVMLVLLGRSMQYEPERTTPGGAPAAESTTEGASEAPAGETAPVAPGGELAAAAALVRHAEVGFRSPEALAEHFEKHGAEFGEVTADGYLLLAQALRDRPLGGEVLEKVRADGVITRFDRARGSFLAFDRDFTIRTFFRPNDGEAYFVRQGLRD